MHRLLSCRGAMAREPIYGIIQALPGIGSNWDEDCYDSNLPNGCYFIVGQPLRVRHTITRPTAASTSGQGRYELMWAAPK